LSSTSTSSIGMSARSARLSGRTIGQTTRAEPMADRRHQRRRQHDVASSSAGRGPPAQGSQSRVGPHRSA
jgi:hypothetical protein